MHKTFICVYISYEGASYVLRFYWRFESKNNILEAEALKGKTNESTREKQKSITLYFMLFASRGTVGAFHKGG